MSVRVNLTTMKTIASTLIDVKPKVNIPLFIWGNHGIGKTEIIKQIAKEKNMECVILNMANIPIEDATGYPVPDKDRRIMDYFPPNWFKTRKTEPVLYFCDEINRAPKYVLQGLFNFINEGRIHENTIKENDVVIVAGNPDSQDYDVTGFDDKAWLSRFAHLFVAPTTDEFLAYLTNTKANSVIINTVKLHSDILSKPIECNIESTPNNRALERISKFIDSVSKEKFEEIGYLVMCAMVGTNFATLIHQEWKKSFDIPEIPVLLKMKVEDYPFNKENLDKFNIINTKLVKWVNGKWKKNSLNLTDAEKEGVKRYMLFMPKDYQMTVVNEIYQSDNSKGFEFASIMDEPGKPDSYFTQLIAKK